MVMSPDMVAEEIYDDSELDWVILTANNIINVRDRVAIEVITIYKNHIARKIWI